LARCHRDVSLFDPVHRPHVAEFDVVVVAAVAIDAATERLTASTGLHPATAGFAGAYVADVDLFSWWSC